MIDGWRWPGKGAGVSRALLEVDSSDGWYQIAHPDQVVGCGGKGEGPTDSGDSTMTSLAQSGDGLEPAEDLFHSLAPPLTERVAGMASGAAVDRAVELLRDVRGDVVGPQCAHQFLLIVTLVGAQRDPALARALRRHRQRRRGLGLAAGLRQAGVDHQAVAIVHLHVPRVAELGLFARPFAGQDGFGIGARSVCLRMNGPHPVTTEREDTTTIRR